MSEITRLAVVDISPVPAGGNATDACANSVELARCAEQVGYHRYWVAEHHGAATTNAGSNPEVLIARIAAMTDRIRVGSGTVLLNHYSPFKVAETFRALHAMTPDRIDLGIGRANGLPVTDLALQRDRRKQQRVDDYDAQVAEVMGWLDHAFPEGHPFGEVRIDGGVPGGPQPWLLGSSPNSAVLAGQLGMRYCFAGFINPTGAVAATQLYRDSFQPSPFPSGVQEPYVSLGMNVTCAETDQQADRLRATVELFYRRLRSGRFPTEPLPSADASVRALGDVPAPSRVAPGAWPQHISGSPTRVHEMLQVMAADVGAHEIVVQDLIADQKDRLASYELIAEAFELTTDAAA